jgi:hypothetical protein
MDVLEFTQEDHDLLEADRMYEGNPYYIRALTQFSYYTVDEIEVHIGELHYDVMLFTQVLELMMNRPVASCDEHGWVTVTEHSSGPGFTGAPIYWWTLSCGCSDNDTSADNLDAAR